MQRATTVRGGAGCTYRARDDGYAARDDGSVVPDDRSAARDDGYGSLKKQATTGTGSGDDGCDCATTGRRSGDDESDPARMRCGHSI